MDSFDDERMEHEGGRRRGRPRGQRTTQLAVIAAAVMFALAIVSKTVGM